MARPRDTDVPSTPEEGEPRASASSSSLILGPDPDELKKSAEDEMARLMAGRTKSAEPTSSASSSSLTRPAGDDEMAKLMGSSAEDLVAVPEHVVAEEDTTFIRPRADTSTSAGRIEVVADGAGKKAPPVDRPKTLTSLPTVAQATPKPPSRGVSMQPVHAMAPEDQSNRVFLLLGIGFLAVAVLLYFTRDTDPPPEPAPVVVAYPDDNERASDDGDARDDREAREARESGRGARDDGDERETESYVEQPSSEPEFEAVPPPPLRALGIRIPPPNTPDQAAEALARLPVAPADRIPIGGIGATGLHVDRIAVGSRSERSRCVDSKPSYSVKARDRVNVCFRVVHQREPEEVQVLWQKEGSGTVRRGNVRIAETHAYRTRAYLVLRREYVGRWLVRILSEDGVELARESFTVSP